MKRYRYKNSTDPKQEARFKVPTYVIAMIAVFIVATVYTTIKISSLGTTLVDLENKEKALLLENSSLSDSLVNLSSMTSIEKKAEELGYEKPQNIIYLGVQDSVAQLR